MDSQDDTQRFAERQSNFRGSAKIPLRFLDFGETLVSGHLDPKNITRIVQIFELEGCLRLDLENHIPAIISEDVLEQSLCYSQVAHINLLQPHAPSTLELPPDYKLQCLHGKHRIAAAKTFLLPGNNWWIVDFYSVGLREASRRDIREEYANSRNFCDGDIFQQIRYYQRAQDIEGEGRWFARLSETKRKDVRQLQRRKDLQIVAQALDDLLPYIGFWPSLPIGTFHGVWNLKCPEELQHYLNHIRVYWDKVIDGDPNVQPLIDFRTIQLLQTRNPWASRDDRDFIIDLMDRKQLFPMIQDTAMRSRILNNLQIADCMIPSLYTFFEDIKWLAPCAKVIRDLLPDGCRESTRRALSRCYTGVNQRAGTVRIEHRNPGFIDALGSEVQAVDSGYQQLWLFAWRHFSELSGDLPRKDVGRPKPRFIASNEQCWFRLAQLAGSLGFESEKITPLQTKDPDLKMAYAFLLQARPESFYQTSDEARRAPVSEICRVLKSIMQEPAFAFPPRVPPEALISPPVKHRCGRPFEQSHNESKAFFYLTNIHRTREKTLSYFTVNRDIFRAFFGHQHPLGFSGPTMTPSVADIRNEIRSDVLMAEPVTQNQQTTRPQPTLEEFSFTQGPRNIAPVEMRAVPHPATDSHVAREEPPDQNMQEAQPETAGIDEDVFIGDAPDEATETAVAANATTQPVAIPPVETAFVEGVANGATETAVAANATTQPVAIPPVETAFVEGAAIGATEIAAVANATTQPVGAQPVESVPENSPGQRIPWLPLSTPKKLSLFQEWERQCKEGDLFVVDVGKLEGVNYDLRASGPYKLPDPIISAAARHYFLVFTNNMMSSRRCAPVKVRSLRRYVKGPDYDGVVYKYIRDHDIFFSPEDRKQGLGFMGVSAFTRELPELGIEVLEGSTTESRLRKLEETHKKKKRTTNFPPDDLLHKKPFSMSSSGA